MSLQATQVENTQRATLLDSDIPSLEPLCSHFTDEKISKPLTLDWLRQVHAVQKRLVSSIPDQVPFLAYPDQVNAKFYSRYFEGVGADEKKTTTDKLQLYRRIIHHPAYEQVINSDHPVQFTFAGPASGIDTIEALLIRQSLHQRSRSNISFVGIEPHPPTYHNPHIDPYYTQRLEDLANFPRKNNSDILFLLGSLRMDIPKIIDRLDTTLAMNSLVRLGGYVAIDEAVPPTSMPAPSNQSLSDMYNYDYPSNWHQVFHPSLPPGYFERKWSDKKGEFSKVFYAEPLEIYFSVMQLFGFSPTLTPYDETQELLHDSRLLRPWNRIERLKSRVLAPTDTFSHIFYQSTDGDRAYDRYVLFWQKTGDPDPEMLQLMEELHD